MARTGTGTIAAGESKKVVADVTVAADSLIAVSLTTDPSTKAGGASVSHVTKSAGVGFTVYFTNPVYSTVSFDYSIL